MTLLTHVQGGPLHSPLRDSRVPRRADAATNRPSPVDGRRQGGSALLLGHQTILTCWARERSEYRRRLQRNRATPSVPAGSTRAWRTGAQLSGCPKATFTDPPHGFRSEAARLRHQRSARQHALARSSSLGTHDTVRSCVGLTGYFVRLSQAVRSIVQGWGPTLICVEPYVSRTVWTVLPCDPFRQL